MKVRSDNMLFASYWFGLYFLFIDLDMSFLLFGIYSNFKYRYMQKKLRMELTSISVTEKICWALYLKLEVADPNYSRHII